MAMSKYQELAKTLRKQIADGACPDLLPAENVLADSYGVSRQTVRSALACLVREGLVEKRQGSGTRLRTQRVRPGRRIAVVPCYINDYIFPGVLQDVQLTLTRQGYTPILFTTLNQSALEREILQRILAAPDLCGVIMEGVRTALPNPNLDFYRRLSDEGIPVVFLYGCCAEVAALPHMFCVADDNVGGGYRLVQYLAGLGHTQIAGIFKSDDRQGPQRYYGCACAARDSGLAFRNQNTLWYTTEDRQELLDYGKTELLKGFITGRLADCTAVVCYNDEIAYPLLRFLQASGIRVPEDISLVSFDNAPSVSAVRITSLAHAQTAAGQAAARCLIDNLCGKHTEAEALPWTLVKHGSVAPRPGSEGSL